MFQENIEWDGIRNKRYWNFCEICYINMVDISRKMYATNGIKTIVVNDGMLWIIEKHTEEELPHKNV